MIIAAVALLAGVLLAGCCQKCRKSREAATRPIQGIVWHLVEFNGKPVDASDRYELSFLADGRVSANATVSSVPIRYSMPTAASRSAR